MPTYSTIVCGIELLAEVIFTNTHSRRLPLISLQFYRFKCLYYLILSKNMKVPAHSTDQFYRLGLLLFETLEALDDI